MSDRREVAHNVNVLVLDGGGASGLSSLIILRELMRRVEHCAGLSEPPDVRDYFDIVAGTGTGAVAVCMLGRLRMSLDQVISCYQRLAGVFSDQKLLGTSAFKTSNLRATLKRIVHEATGDENARMLDTSPGADKCRTDLQGGVREVEAQHERRGPCGFPLLQRRGQPNARLRHLGGAVCNYGASGIVQEHRRRRMNGSIPLACLEQLAKNHAPNESVGSSELSALIGELAKGVKLDEINDFFKLFPAIYALTSSVHALGIAARAVLKEFLQPRPSSSGIDGAPAVAQCSYLELRSTPRETAEISRTEYVHAVLDEVEKYPADRAALILSVDRRMSRAVADEVVDIAIQMKGEGRRIVGVDLCGSPLANDVSVFDPPLVRAREAGLGLTLHIAETADNSTTDTMDLLNLLPADSKARLGHATFLDPAAQLIVLNRKHAVEICLSSNLLCKTVSSIDVHHITEYMKAGHPVAISTDDILPFRTTLVAEYAMLMAPPPLGLGLGEDEVRKIAGGGLNSRF